MSIIKYLKMSKRDKLWSKAIKAAVKLSNEDLINLAGYCKALAEYRKHKG